MRPSDKAAPQPASCVQEDPRYWSAKTAYGWSANSVGRGELGIVRAYVQRETLIRRAASIRHAEAVDGYLRITGSVWLPRAELAWRFSRSSGPGGQSVNTTDSRVELRFDLAATNALPDHLKERAMQALAPRLVDGVLTMSASEHRSQLQNRRAAEARLVMVLADAIAPPARPRRVSRPSRGAVQARLDAKRRRAQLKRQRRTLDD
jgi:ribosome-associated protein